MCRDVNWEFEGVLNSGPLFLTLEFLSTYVEYIIHNTLQNLLPKRQVILPLSLSVTSIFRAQYSVRLCLTTCSYGAM